MECKTRFLCKVVQTAWVHDNLAGGNSMGQTCWQANFLVNQCGGKINKNNLPSLVLK